jgi:hypothetical protein
MTLSTIRTATTSDLQDVLALYRHLNSDDPVPSPRAAESAWAAMLTAQLVTVYVAELTDGTLAASCTLLKSAEFSTTFRRPIACVRSLRATVP